MKPVRVKIIGITHIDTNWCMNKSVHQNIKTLVYERVKTKTIEDMKLLIRAQYWNLL